MSDDRQALELFLNHRVEDQASYYRSQAATYQAALRRTTRLSASLLVGASLFGALGAIDVARRGLWAFIATALAAVSTAIATYEIAFEFERRGRQYGETNAALALKGIPADGQFVEYVVDVERLLMGEVDSWSRLESNPIAPPGDDDRSG